MFFISWYTIRIVKIRWVRDLEMMSPVFDFEFNEINYLQGSDFIISFHYHYLDKFSLQKKAKWDYPDWFPGKHPDNNLKYSVGMVVLQVPIPRICPRTNTRVWDCDVRTQVRCTYAAFTIVYAIEILGLPKINTLIICTCIVMIFHFAPLFIREW